MKLDEAIAIDMIKQLATQAPIAKWEHREAIRDAILVIEAMKFELDSFRSDAGKQSVKP